ncbi:MAG TPA: hypothetical protein VGR35_08525 [Tepidisphaeraceae bacterium]|nr:hypothetical protein [Tepidisphaeraceae bacterium]
MTTLNVNLPDNLKTFAEKQAAAHQLSSASEYIESLLAREELELALLDGLNSGPATEVDDGWLERKRQQLVAQAQAKP